MSAAFLVCAAAAAGGVQVRFIDPQHYTDARLDGYGATDERVLRTLERHLQELGGRCLDAGDTLDIQILDIDLAGQQEWWRRSGARNLRVMRDVTWPRIRLAYALRRADGEIIESRERLSDMNYLWSSAYVRTDSMELPYERAMLSSWFSQSFCR
ncbi:MAG: DUF3016 domain-containing protein [Noviherbaspirillum sp.]